MPKVKKKGTTITRILKTLQSHSKQSIVSVSKFEHAIVSVLTTNKSLYSFKCLLPSFHLLLLTEENQGTEFSSLCVLLEPFIQQKFTRSN